MHAFHNWVHVIIYTIGAMLALLTGVGSVVSGLTDDDEASQARAAGAVLSIRQFADPAAWFAMGLLLVGHVHDPAPLSVGLHTTFGYFLMMLGLAVFLCSLIHDVLPFQSAVCSTMRSVHALAWLLTGGITITMCVVKYGTPHGAFKAYLDGRGIHPMSDFEELSAYTSATLLGCVLHLALLHWSSPQLEAPKHLATMTAPAQELNCPEAVSLMEEESHHASRQQGSLALASP